MLCSFLLLLLIILFVLFFFFFNDTATTEIYTLSLHDALPISKNSATPKISGGRRPKRSEAGRSESTRLNSSHTVISYAVFCLKKKKKNKKGNLKYQNGKFKIKRKKKQQNNKFH